MITGVVAALRAEARTLGPPQRRPDGLEVLRDGTLVAVSGMGPDAASRAALALVRGGSTSLVSWGLAGGLDPQWPAGTLCLPELIVGTDGRTFPTDRHWREMLEAAVAMRRRIAGGRLLTRDAAIVDIAAKAAAYRDSGALAVDMESAAIAAVAAQHQLPFVAVRVIVDAARDAVPASVVAAMGDGQVRIARLLAALAGRPQDLRPLLAMALRFQLARRALVEVARTGLLAPLALATSSPGRVM